MVKSRLPLLLYLCTFERLVLGAIRAAAQMMGHRGRALTMTGVWPA
jgi:hypothetical protein